MNCELARTEMIAYLQSELPDAQKTALEMHLAGCPDCRAKLEEARRLLEWTAAASDESVVRTVDDLIHDAIEARVSDIHLDPQQDNSLRVRYRIDGVLQDVRRLDPLVREGIVARVKVMSEMNLAERRVPQDGRITLNSRDGAPFEFVVNCTPFAWGEGIVIRILDKGRTLPTMDELGLATDSLDAIQHLLHQPSGLLVVAGPIDTGKPITIYAMLREVNTPGVKVVTAENGIYYRVEGVNHAQKNGRVGMTIPTILRSFLRQDPDVVIVGDMAEAETVPLCLQIALTGHLVIAGLDTGDALSSIQHLRNMGAEDVVLGGALIGVVAQRQVRKVCQTCKQAYIAEANDPYLRALGITAADMAGRTLVRAVGCDACRRTGYRGRTNLFEVLTLNREISSLIVNGAEMVAITNAARAAGHRSLRDDARQKVLDGVTTPEEVIRVLA
jgi:type IV pilus assembly protein PilB